MEEVDYFRAQAIELLELRVESIPCSGCFFRSDAPLVQFAQLVTKQERLRVYEKRGGSSFVC